MPIEVGVIVLAIYPIVLCVAIYLFGKHSVRPD